MYIGPCLSLGFFIFSTMSDAFISIPKVVIKVLNCRRIVMTRAVSLDDRMNYVPYHYTINANGRDADYSIYLLIALERAVLNRSWA